jgi:CheY-like chemotaxis protein
LTAGDYVKVGIKDAGVGIPKEILPKIFDPFFTTKKNGTGLGLATAYSIIKSHGGCITVDSEVGEGTTFEFYLPVSQQEGKISTFREKPVLKKGNGETILIMDDEDDVLMVASKMTKRLGYRVETAKNGAVAIKKFIQAGQNNNPPIAAILMDLTIRGGMGGMETVRRILEIDPSAKVIVSSGYSDDTTMANFKKYGFAGCIAKPYRVETLGEELARVLRSV